MGENKMHLIHLFVPSLVAGCQGSPSTSTFSRSTSRYLPCALPTTNQPLPHIRSLDLLERLLDFAVVLYGHRIIMKDLEPSLIA